MNLCAAAQSNGRRCETATAIIRTNQLKRILSRPVVEHCTVKPPIRRLLDLYSLLGVRGRLHRAGRILPCVRAPGISATLIPGSREYLTSLLLP